MPLYTKIAFASCETINKVLGKKRNFLGTVSSYLDPGRKKTEILPLCLYYEKENFGVELSLKTVIPLKVAERKKDIWIHNRKKKMMYHSGSKPHSFSKLLLKITVKEKLA